MHDIESDIYTKAEVDVSLMTWGQEPKAGEHLECPTNSKGVLGEQVRVDAGREGRAPEVTSGCRWW